jgi:UDP-N-acetylglucosamine--N-acetylmuramyl-(pentapeptide) pyrophosphoryl-undecaprenol N-acetylglucosamine transferase
MTSEMQPSIRVAIACGGTGGHLFPGLAVAESLLRRGCAVTLLISPKEVDQQAVKAAVGMQIVSLPAVGLTRCGKFEFLRGFIQSYRAARKHFFSHAPHAVLAMGGFTSAPPILAGKQLGAQTFLHESNSIPGRANRFLSWIVDRAFVGFPASASHLHTKKVTATGTPVRPQFQPRPAAQCRAALGLDPERPVVLVTGGSQGATGINELVLHTLPLLMKQAPELQWFHLSGTGDEARVMEGYATAGVKAVVHPFFAGMELALGAATVAVSRAGASSLAELAAMRVPAVLVPYPAAMDNHQFYNAKAFESSGAAVLLEQRGATPEAMARCLLDLIRNAPLRAGTQAALAQWHAPRAAEEIAEAMLEAVGMRVPGSQRGGVATLTSLPDKSRSYDERGRDAPADFKSALQPKAAL